MDFDCENIMDFAMDIDKLNLANLEGKVMDKIMEYPVATLRQLRILQGINEPYCSVQTGVSSQNILKSLPKGDLLFLKKTNLKPSHDSSKTYLQIR